MASTTPWGKTTLRVTPHDSALGIVEKRLGPPSRPTKNGNWLLNLEAAADTPWQEQVRLAEAFLVSNHQALLELAEFCSITLLVSWTPKAGQDSLGFTVETIAALASLRAAVLIDTYTDD